ncbi:hypothetical protein HDU67_006629 [Dinochytrium kinnereticum]|nr:hypothetical protein HDU67_006629 [Dinochytrium kinnereticum]
MPASQPVRVAIVGAGAAGSSAAYFLRDMEVGGARSEVTVFEGEERVGGRVKRVEIEGVGVEIGASIFGALWRWGYLSTTRSRALALDAGERFGLNYEKAAKGELGFETVEGLLRELGIWEEVGVSAEEFFGKRGVGELYLREFVEAATRVNYGQNLDLNALAALVCLVAAFVPAESIEGGNERIFSEMLRVSEAKVLLGTPVVKIRRVLGEDGEVMYGVLDGKGIERFFDVVVLGVPGNKALESIDFSEVPKPKPTPFVHLHVTLVVGTLNPTYFGLTPTDVLPSTILTCRQTLTNATTLPFNSVAVKTVLKDGVTTITKIFSPRRIDDELLGRMYLRFGDVYRFEWDSYPVLQPAGELGSFLVEGVGKGGVYHVNALEAAVSTMESETVAARNVVQLLKKRWEGDAGKVKAKL